MGSDVIGSLLALTSPHSSFWGPCLFIDPFYSPTYPATVHPLLSHPNHLSTQLLPVPSPAPTSHLPVKSSTHPPTCAPSHARGWPSVPLPTHHPPTQSPMYFPVPLSSHPPTCPSIPESPPHLAGCSSTHPSIHPSTRLLYIHHPPTSNPT